MHQVLGFKVIICSQFSVTSFHTFQGFFSANVISIFLLVKHWKNYCILSLIKQNRVANLPITGIWTLIILWDIQTHPWPPPTRSEQHTPSHSSCDKQKYLQTLSNAFFSPNSMRINDLEVFLQPHCPHPKALYVPLHWLLWDLMLPYLNVHLCQSVNRSGFSNPL